MYVYPELPEHHSLGKENEIKIKMQQFINQNYVKCSSLFYISPREARGTISSVYSTNIS